MKEHTLEILCQWILVCAPWTLHPKLTGEVLPCFGFLQLTLWLLKTRKGLRRNLLYPWWFFCPDQEKHKLRNLRTVEYQYSGSLCHDGVTLKMQIFASSARRSRFCSGFVALSDMWLNVPMTAKLSLWRDCCSLKCFWVTVCLLKIHFVNKSHESEILQSNTRKLRVLQWSLWFEYFLSFFEKFKQAKETQPRCVTLPVLKANSRNAKTRAHFIQVSCKFLTCPSNILPHGTLFTGFARGDFSLCGRWQYWLISFSGVKQAWRCRRTTLPKDSQKYSPTSKTCPPPVDVPCWNLSLCREPRSPGSVASQSTHSASSFVSKRLFAQ